MKEENNNMYDNPLADENLKSKLAKSTEDKKLLLKI